MTGTTTDQSPIVPAPIVPAKIDATYRRVIDLLRQLRDSPSSPRLGPLVLTERVAGGIVESGGSAGATTTGGPPTLVDALFVAAVTRRPLLITGPPGVGKTAVAYALNSYLGDNGLSVSDRPAALTFSSRTDREALLGGVDHVRRLAAAQQGREGLAEAPFDAGVFGAAFRVDPSIQASTTVDVCAAPDVDAVVVLLDEIDKADPSLPNDLLDVLDRQSFEDELGRIHRAATAVLTVVTSNAERDLPPAFVRRCIPFHMEVPDVAGLVAIGAAAFEHDTRLGDHDRWDDQAITALASAFRRAHDDAPNRHERSPGTAEFLDALVTAVELGVDDSVTEIERMGSMLWSKRPG